MDELFEIIVPVVIGLFYILSHFFSKNEEAEGEGGRSERSSEETRSLEAELNERQRQAREAIRKKIEERRRAGAPPQREAQNAPTATLREPTTHTPRQTDRASKPQPVVGHPDIFVDADAPSEDSFETRQRLIEATRARAESLRSKIDRRPGSVAESSIGRKAVGGRRRPRSSYRSRLNNSQSVREAFVLKELLDKPVGMRNRQ